MEFSIEGEETAHHPLTYSQEIEKRVKQTVLQLFIEAEVVRNGHLDFELFRTIKAVDRVVTEHPHSVMFESKMM